MDAVLECNAPFCGEVVTIYEPLACYRIHDSNLYAVNTIDAERFTAKGHTFELKVDYLAQRCRRWGIRFDPAAARNRSIWLLECRLVAAKLGENPADEPTFIRLTPKSTRFGDDFAMPPIEPCAGTPATQPAHKMSVLAVS